MFADIGVTEIMLIVGVITLLFGAKRIPEIAKGLGKGIKEFKTEINSIQDTIKPIKNKE